MKSTTCFLMALTPWLASMTTAVPTTPSAPVHCQVPCGIYGDRMRIDMLMEDATTIEKAMQQIAALEAAEAPNYNQIVRWVSNKETHAQNIQDTVAAYWLAQRIKAPKAGAEAAAVTKYRRQLELSHGMIVAAMKCKQTTDAANVAVLRAHALDFSAAYFSAEDLEHIRAHHAEEK